MDDKVHLNFMHEFQTRFIQSLDPWQIEALYFFLGSTLSEHLLFKLLESYLFNNSGGANDNKNK